MGMKVLGGAALDARTMNIASSLAEALQILGKDHDKAERFQDACVAAMRAFAAGMGQPVTEGVMTYEPIAMIALGDMIACFASSEIDKARGAPKGTYQRGYALYLAVESALLPRELLAAAAEALEAEPTPEPEERH